MNRILGLILLLVLTPVAPLVPRASAAPTIADIKLIVTCNTSVLVNFNTSTPTHAFLEYGTTTDYGSATIDDSVRLYREHAIQITGLNSSTLYHFRVVAIDSGGTATSSDQTFTTTTNDGACPALPSQVDSRMPDMTGAVERTVKASGGNYTPAQFQTALNDAGTANEKRIITIDAGLTLTGQFLMPANADQNWIIIRTSAHAQLPEGKRVFPADASKLVKIQNINVDPPIIFAAASNHIRLIGIEATIDPAAIGDAPGGTSQSAGFINLVENVANNPANLPKFITVDRSWIHGHPTKNTIRGMQISGEDIVIIDSYVNDFHHNGFDSQAILGLAMKRVKILNCTLIGSGENFMWGGTGIGVAGYVVGGLEYLRNHMYHPRQWKENAPDYAGNEWAEKNLFELKTSAKVFIAFNYFGGTTDEQGGFWPDAQSLAINFKLEQNSAVGTCDLLEDIVFYKNFGENLHAGVAITGRQNSAQGCTNKPDRILFRDNVLELDASTWTPEPGCSSCSWNATGFNIGGVEDVQVVHNTIINANPTQVSSCESVFGNGVIALIGDPVATKWGGFVFKDNISDYRGCGFSASESINNATAALNNHFVGWIVTNNGFMRTGGAAPNWPAGQIWATSYTGRFVNFNSGLDGNYRLAGGTTWDNAASDGTDLGADIEGVERAVLHTPDGNWSSASAGGLTVCRWSTKPPCGSQ